MTSITSSYLRIPQSRITRCEFPSNPTIHQWPQTMLTTSAIDGILLLSSIRWNFQTYGYWIFCLLTGLISLHSIRFSNFILRRNIRSAFISLSRFTLREIFFFFSNWLLYRLRMVFASLFGRSYSLNTFLGRVYVLYVRTERVENNIPLKITLVVFFSIRKKCTLEK